MKCSLSYRKSSGQWAEANHRLFCLLRFPLVPSLLRLSLLMGKIGINKCWVWPYVCSQLPQMLPIQWLTFCTKRTMPSVCM